MSCFNSDDEVTICPYHRERTTQLIWTFAFPYKEFWCPACGAKWGMMGAGDNAKWTPTIHDRYVKDKERSNRFLNAVSTLNCAYFKYKGKDIKPSEMPDKLRKYYKNIISKWKYIK